jgi:hypothetical protein
MVYVGLVWQPHAAKKKSDAKPEAHSAAHDGVIDSTDDGRAEEVLCEILAPSDLPVIS